MHWNHSSRIRNHRKTMFKSCVYFKLPDQLRMEWQFWCIDISITVDTWRQLEVLLSHGVPTLIGREAPAGSKFRHPVEPEEHSPDSIASKRLRQMKFLIKYRPPLSFCFLLTLLTADITRLINILLTNVSHKRNTLLSWWTWNWCKKNWLNSWCLDQLTIWNIWKTLEFHHPEHMEILE